VCEIKLSSGNKALVDGEQFARASLYNWHETKRNNTSYAVAHIDGKTVYLHHFILGLQDQVDHKNRNGLDCRKENMRSASHRQNGRNIVQPQTEDGTGYRGVSKSRTRFAARIRDENGYKKHLGVFETAEEAARAYDAAAREIHGEFAVLNFA
jgi:hypothetical protein